MIDYSLIYFLLFFFVWLYILNLSVENEKSVTLKYIQFLVMIPLIISISANAYINSFVFGHIFSLSIGLLSIYALTKGLIK